MAEAQSHAVAFCRPMDSKSRGRSVINEARFSACAESEITTACAVVVNVRIRSHSPSNRHLAKSGYLPDMIQHCEQI